MKGLVQMMIEKNDDLLSYLSPENLKLAVNAAIDATERHEHCDGSECFFFSI